MRWRVRPSVTRCIRRNTDASHGAGNQAARQAGSVVVSFIFFRHFPCRGAREQQPRGKCNGEKKLRRSENISLVIEEIPSLARFPSLRINGHHRIHLDVVSVIHPVDFPEEFILVSHLFFSFSQ